MVQSTFSYDYFRSGFDLIVSPVLGPPGGDVWQECAQMLPARRKYLLSFQGELRKPKTPFPDLYNNDDTSFVKEDELDKFIIEHFRQLANTETSDRFLFEFECMPASDNNIDMGVQDWALCGTDSSRRTILKESTFALIFAPDSNLITSTLLQARVYEALRSGKITNISFRYFLILKNIYALIHSIIFTTTLSVYKSIS